MAIGIRRRWRRLIRWASSNDGIWGAVGIIVALIALVIATMLDRQSSLENSEHSDLLNKTMKRTIIVLDTMNNSLVNQAKKFDISIGKETAFITKLDMLNNEIQRFQGAIQSSDENLSDRLNKLREEIGRLKKAIAADNGADSASLAHILNQSAQHAAHQMRGLSDLIAALKGAVDDLSNEMRRSNNVSEGVMRRIDLKMLTDPNDEDDDDLQYANSCESGRCLSLLSACNAMTLQEEYYSVSFSVQANQISSAELYLLVYIREGGRRFTQCGELTPDELISVIVDGEAIRPQHLEEYYDAYPIKLSAAVITLTLKRNTRRMSSADHKNSAARFTNEIAAKSFRFNARISSRSSSTAMDAVMREISIVECPDEKKVEEVIKWECLYANYPG